MRKLVVAALVIAVSLCAAFASEAKGKTDKGEAGLSAAPSVADKSYTNSDFKFTLRFPSEWEAREDKSETPDFGSGAAGMIGRKLMGGVKMTKVCFGTKKCDAGNFGKEPQAHLIIADVASMERMVPRAKGDKGSRAEKGGEVKSDCDMVEKMNVKWAGATSPWVAMRCPEKKRWRYTTTVTMQRGAANGKDMFNLMCSMLSGSKEKEESLAEYKADLKPRCQKLVSTTRFIK